MSFSFCHCHPGVIHAIAMFIKQNAPDWLPQLLSVLELHTKMHPYVLPPDVRIGREDWAMSMGQGFVSFLVLTVPDNLLKSLLHSDAFWVAFTGALPDSSSGLSFPGCPNPFQLYCSGKQLFNAFPTMEDVGIPVAGQLSCWGRSAPVQLLGSARPLLPNRPTPGNSFPNFILVSPGTVHFGIPHLYTPLHPTLTKISVPGWFDFRRG
jgi:hypothetical protein